MLIKNLQMKLVFYMQKTHQKPIKAYLNMRITTLNTIIYQLKTNVKITSNKLSKFK